jgi:hypothetical protein
MAVWRWNEAQYADESTNNDELKHYGVKGMKWGVVKEYKPMDTTSVNRHESVYTTTNNKSPVQNTTKAERNVANMKKRASYQVKRANSRSPVKATNTAVRHPADTTGRYGRGNIDLNDRKVVRNRDGSISTERSFSTNIDGKEVLLPTVIDGKVVSEDEAIDYYLQTGKHLGQFDTVKEAEDYAEQLHNRQDWYYNQREKLKKHSDIKNQIQEALYRMRKKK